MKLLDLDREAPATLRTAAVLVFLGSLLYAGLLLQPTPVPNIPLLLLLLYCALSIPGRVTRLEPWMYWLNAVLIAPVVLAFLGVLVYFDAVGVFSLEGHPVLRALTWSSSVCFAAASILCLVPASKRAADAARTLNGLPIA